jgi:RimJ/RimL family protein N-acetyltransferase
MSAAGPIGVASGATLSFDELHAFVARIGVPRVAFQGDHYDLDEPMRFAALASGALAVDGREIVRALSTSGLRRGPGLTRQGLAGVAHLDAPTIETARLTLRQWQATDVPAAAAMHADGRVGRWLGGVLSAEQSAAFVDRQAVGLALRGIGLFAVEETTSATFVGAVGLGGVGRDFPFGPALEVAWRLAPDAEGRGYATEAAKAVLDYADSLFRLRRIAAFTTVTNVASLAVMNRLDMVPDDDLPDSEFDHPRLAPDHPLRRHTLRWWNSPANQKI